MCVLGLVRRFSPQPKPLAHIGWQSPKKEAILTIAEHDRWLLHNRLRDVIGSQEADILMEIAEFRIAMRRCFRTQMRIMVASMIATQSISVAIMASMVNSLR